MIVNILAGIVLFAVLVAALNSKHPKDRYVLYQSVNSGLTMIVHKGSELDKELYKAPAIYQRIFTGDLYECTQLQKERDHEVL